ncbi:MAG: hypothetical protein ACR2QR_06155 [Woeseiaceae bacterium]
MKRLYDELRRRSVFRIAAAYLAGAWLIVQLMESLLPIFGYPETSGRPVVIMLVAGFIPALFLAWFFQYTPQGLKAQDELDLAADTDPVSNRTFDTVVIVFLLAAVSYFVVDKFVLEPARVEVMVETAVEDALAAPLDRTIAVMPFIDLSPEGNQEYFSDGLSEELLNLLAKIPDLKVASRTSSFAFKGKDAQISEIAEALSVGHVLEGSVRMSGNRIRVTAQLIKASDGYHLWSDTFERELDDVLHVQDEIAAQVVEELEVTLVDPAPKTRKTDGRAYSLYLQANYLNQQYTQESMERSVELLQEVLEIDPDYVPAMTRLAGVYMNLATSNSMPAADAMALAKNHAERAAELDPTFAFAYSQLGWIAHMFEGDLAAASRNYALALVFDPGNPGVIGNAAVTAEALGLLDESIRMKEYLVQVAPEGAIGWNNLALAYYFDRQLEKAEEAIHTTLLLSPEYIGANYRLGKILLHQDRYEEALAAFEQELDEEYKLKGQAVALFALDRTEEADAALQQLVDDWGESYPSEIAHAYAYRDEKDKAFEWLEIRYEKGGAGTWGEQRLDLLWTNLHSDPRWDDYLRKMNVAPEQLDQIEFNITVPEAAE